MRRSGVWGMTAMLLVGLAGPATRAKEPPRTEPAPGEVLHFTKGEILVAHKKGA